MVLQQEDEQQVRYCYRSAAGLVLQQIDTHLGRVIRKRSSVELLLLMSLGCAFRHGQPVVDDAGGTSVTGVYAADRVVGRRLAA
jgi:hypothetical protein